MNCYMEMKYKNRGPSLYLDICTVMALVGEPNMQPVAAANMI
jgi:hypothetical protein